MLQRSRGGVAIEQSLNSILNPGDYRVEFVFAGSTNVVCETLSVSLGLVPSSVLVTRSQASDATFGANVNDLFPAVPLNVFGGTPSWKVQYDSVASGAALRFHSFVRGQSATDPRFLYALNFTVPTLNTPSNRLWRVVAQIGADFVTSGSLGILLTPATSAAPSLSCLGTDACVGAHYLIPNTKVIDRRLPGGDYRLWIYDNAAQRFTDRTIMPAITPFTFKMDATHITEEEDFLNCPEGLLPRSFDDPGFMTSDGRLQVNRHFLLDSQVRVHQVNFTLPQGTDVKLFRSKVSENRVVDVDLRLLGPDGKEIAQSRFARPLEENIVAQLWAPGMYSLEISYFGAFTAGNCETFHLVVAMAPVSAAADYCDSVVDVPLPELSPSSDLNDQLKFSFSTGHSQPVVYANRSALAWTMDFHVESSASNAHFRARIGHDFLLGHLMMVLSSAEQQQSIVATLHSTTLEISEFLEQGVYTLHILPGQEQANANVTSFPACVKFTLELNITAESTTHDPLTDVGCWQWPMLPANLILPQYLDNPSHQMYLSGRFLFPPGDYVKRAIALDVPSDSLLRAYVDPHPDRRIDMDLVLYENGRQVAWSLLGSGFADQVVYRLQNKTEYILEVHMYRIGSHSLCDSFGFEMAVEPVPSDLWTAPCSPEEYFPPASDFFVTDPTSWPWNRDQIMSFTQRLNVTETFSFPIQLPSAAFLRVQVSFEFLWGALSLTLKDGGNFTIQTGTGGSNSNNLGPVRLDAGTYTLLISHSSIPFASTDDAENSARCTRFLVRAAIDDASSSDEASLGPAAWCSYYSFPSSFTSAAGLHPLSGQRLHFARHVLMLTDLPARDETTFTVTKDSLFRFYVPELELYDVDAVLTNKNTSTVVFQVTNRGENSRVRKIPAGVYSFATRYYAQIGADPLPPTSACISFPLQVEIIPMSDVTSSPAGSGPASCPVVNPPDQLNVGTGETVVSFSHRMVANSPFGKNFTLSLSSNTLAFISVEADFGTSLTWFRLLRGSEVPLLPVMSDSKASFYGELRAGDWIVQLYHPKGDDTNPPPAEITCANVTLRYNLVGGVAPSDCSLRQLPSDLAPLQEAGTGAIHFYGESFRAPPLRSMHYIKFSVPQKSVWRIFVQSDSQTSVDIDLKLYNSTDKSHLVDSFSRAGLIEEARLILPGQTEAYVLELFAYSVHHETTVDCPSLLVFMAMEPPASILDDRRCPANIPASAAALPPASIRFVPGASYSFARQTFILNTTVIAPYVSGVGVARRFRYPIALEVRERTEFRASVGSNFLAQDVGVSLDGQFVAKGLPNQSEGVEDFDVSVSRVLAPGVYNLMLWSNMLEVIWEGVNESVDFKCLQFSLEMRGVAEDQALPAVVEIFPGAAAGVDFNPRYNLRVRIDVDHLIDVPAPASFGNTVVAGPLVYLVDRAEPNTKIPPKQVLLSSSRTRFFAEFNSSSLKFDHTYDLKLLVDQFKSNNVPFILGVALPSYHMETCQCNGHGHCDNNSHCVCDTGYAGIMCASCSNGYHFAGTGCVQNVPCTPTFCGDHGNCTNTHGYPECKCLPGYATIGNTPCGRCATGYEGYPNCKLASEEGPATCGLTILPLSLNGPGFLGFDGSVHLSGRYYLDTLSSVHNMLFKVDQESLVRLYVEPHAVDVDIALREDLGGGKLSNNDLAGSYKFGGEEVIFKVVPPGQYGIVFMYSGGQIGVASVCDAAKIELVIRPTLTVQSSNNNVPDKCNEATPSSQLFLDSTVLNTSSVVALQEGTDVIYDPPQTFALSNVDAHPPASGRRVVGFKVFKTPNVGVASNLRALFTLEVAYRFETGDLGVILQKGNMIGSPLKCEKVSADCLFGTNGYDRNAVRAFLQPGTFYTAWIYEPVAQNASLSKCSLFQVTLEVKWRQNPTSEALGCPGARMPDFLMDSGYGGHWAQRVALMPRPQNTTIQVGPGGMRFRVSLNLNAAEMQTSDVEGVDIAIFKGDSKIPVMSTYTMDGHDIGAFQVDLTAGTYRLKLEMIQLLVDAGQETARCRFVDVELAYEKVGSPVPALGCPTNGVDVLPQIPVGLSISQNSSYMLPFINATTKEMIAYYSFSNSGAVVVEVPFTVSQDTIFSASVVSAFLPSQAVLLLYQSEQNKPMAASANHYNEAKIHAMELNAGSFVLKMSFVEPDTRYACRPFHFHLFLQPSRDVETAKPETDALLSTVLCEEAAVDGLDYIPSTLNSWKYLNADGRMDFHSDKVSVPVEIQIQRDVFRTTKFVVGTDSIFRLSLDSPDYLSISSSVHLLFADNKTEIGVARGYQSLSELLAPNVSYILNWTFYNYAADPVSPTGGEATWCRVMSVHLSVKPLSWGTMSQNLCPGGATKFPDDPLIPTGAHVPSSISPFIAGDLSTYYIMQSVNSPQSHTYSFTLDAPSNILVETLFDFSFLELRISLRRTDVYLMYRGRLSVTGATLLASGLAAGSYELVISEPTISTVGNPVVGCRPFAFRLVVEADEGSQRGIRGFLPVPNTLNDVGYLNYDGSLHFAHEYDLENVNLIDSSKVSEITNLTVTADSVLRVFVRLLDSSKEDVMAPLLRVVDYTASSKSMARPAIGRPQLTLDYFLSAGHQYQLQWGAKQSVGQGLIPSSDVQIYVELAIHPVRALAAAIGANALYHNVNACSGPTQLPDIKPDPNGLVLFGKNDLTVSSVTGRTVQGKIASTTFTLLDESVFYTMIESQFQLSRLYLSVKSLNVTHDDLIGQSDRNRRFIHEVLPAGTYELSLNQNWTEDQPEVADLAHCTVFSIKVMVRPSWQGSSQHIADCTGFDILPWNLSNPVPFGKEMDASSGALTMYGDHFLYPEKLHGSDGYTFLQLSFPNHNSLHVMTYFHFDSFMVMGQEYPADFSILAFDQMSVPFTVPAYGDQGNRAYRLGRFHLEEAVAAVVQVMYSKYATGLGSCPYFAFGTYAHKSSALSNLLMCTSGQLQHIHSTPTLQPVLNADGTYYEHSYGAFTSDQVGPQTFKIKFTVTRTSVVHFAFGSNGFVSSVGVNMSQVGANNFRWPAGAPVMLRSYEDHNVNVRHVDTNFLPPGTFEIAITHTSLAQSSGLTNGRGQTISGSPLCMPWSLDLWITPWLPGGTSYVVGVSPAQLWSFRPHVDLIVQITVEDILYASDATVADFNDYVAGFYLAVDGSSQKIHPSSASAPGSGVGVALRWAAGTLSIGQSYTLSSVPGVLTTREHQSLSFISQHNYKVVATDYCGANGHFDANYVCVCNEGYGGDDCSVCGVGYVLTGGACVKTTKPVCQPCTCGCDAQNHPIGDCDDSSGSIVCNCRSSAYTGAFCELCADSSQQSHYPVCVTNPRPCSVTCVHGTCDSVAGVCLCEHHWSGAGCSVCGPQFSGDQCDQCATGYSGSQCETSTGTPGWSTWKIAIVALVVLLLAAAAVIGFLAWRRWRKKDLAKKQSYAMTSLGPMTDSSGDEFFDDNIGNEAPVGLLSDQFNLHLSSDEE